MNKGLLFIAFLGLNLTTWLYAGQAQVKVDTTLSQEETAALHWFKEKKHLHTAGLVFDQLPLKDQELLEQKIRYEDDPQAVMGIMKNFTAIFYKILTKSNVETPFKEEVVSSMLLKTRTREQGKEISKTEGNFTGETATSPKRPHVVDPLFGIPKSCRRAPAASSQQKPISHPVTVALDKIVKMATILESALEEFELSSHETPAYEIAALRVETPELA